MAGLRRITLGFDDTNATTFRPAVGERVVVYSAIEVGNPSDLMLSDGTTSVNWRNATANNTIVLIDNDWYLGVNANPSDDDGWLITIGDTI